MGAGSAAETGIALRSRLEIDRPPLVCIALGIAIVRIGMNLDSAAKRRSGNMLRVHRDLVEYPAVRLADRLAHDSSCRRPAQLRLPQPLSGVPTAAVFLTPCTRSLGAGPAQVDGV